MKKLHQIILLMMIAWTPLLAQFNHHCGAEMPYFNPKSHYDLDPVEASDRKIRKLERGNNNSKIVYQVHIHFVNPVGNGLPIEEKDLTDAVADLNNAFYGADIQFEVKHSIIGRAGFAKFNKSKEATIHQAYHKKNVINVYCVDEIDVAQWRNNPGTVSGYAYHPDALDLEPYQKDMIIITYSGLDEQTTLIHEFGHFFGLYHTHENFDKPDRMEYVSRYQCHERGDGLCDTQADPNIASYVDASDPGDCKCNLNGRTDPLGDKYVPSPENFMSYAPTICRTAFTPGQLNRMKHYALVKRRYLKWKFMSSNRWTAKGGGQFKPMESLPSLNTAYAYSNLEPRSKALIIVWDPKSAWSIRMKSEVMNHEFYPYFMGDDARYFLLTYSLQEYTTEQNFTDFMGNDVFAVPKEQNPEYELLRMNFSNEIGPAPGIYLVCFRHPTSVEPRLAYAFEGYKKPREVRALLDKYWNVDYKVSKS